MSENAVYFLNEKPYVNLTNVCTNRCVFCIRNIKDDVCGHDMKLNQEVKAIDVIEEIKNLKDKIENNGKGEFIFCGYGEPLIKLEEIKQISSFIKNNLKNVKIRVNTNGQANLIHKRNIVPELKGLVDVLSISLNAENKELYDELCQPKLEGAYEALKEFALLAHNEGIETVMSIVVGYKNYKIDVEKCKKTASDLGAKFRIREWIKEGYN